MGILLFIMSICLMVNGYMENLTSNIFSGIGCLLVCIIWTYCTHHEVRPKLEYKPRSYRVTYKDK